MAKPHIWQADFNLGYWKDFFSIYVWDTSVISTLLFKVLFPVGEIKTEITKKYLFNPIWGGGSVQHPLTINQHKDPKFRDFSYF